MHRLFANLTQDDAAERIGVATRTLQRYEQDDAHVPSDVVIRMSEVYGTDELVHWHLRHRTPYGRWLDMEKPALAGRPGTDTTDTTENYRAQYNTTA